MSTRLFHSRIKTILTLAVVLLPLTGALAKTIKDPATGYTFDLPDDWAEIPKAEIERVMGVIAKPGNVSFVAGFEPASHTRSFQYPYILVQVVPYPAGLSLDKVTVKDLQELTAGIAGTPVADVKNTLTGEGAALLTSLDGKAAAYTTTPPGFILDIDLTLANVGKIHDHGIGVVGKSQCVVVHLYYAPADAKALEPVIKKIGTTLRLDAAKQAVFTGPATQPAAKP